MVKRTSLGLALAIMALAAWGIYSALDWPLKAKLFPLVIAIPLFCLATAEAMWVIFAKAAAASHAQFASRPVRILVPNPPGGATDTVARVIAPRLGELLGQTVVVENKPGSNGNLAIEMTAKSPDGLTLLLGADAQIVIGPHLYRDLGVDTLKALAPGASLVNTQMVLAVNPTVPVKTLPEFLEYP